MYKHSRTYPGQHPQTSNMENIHDIYPLSSSQIISNLNAKNFLEIAKAKDIHNIIATNEKYKNAIMTYRNCLTNKEIAISLHLKYTNIDTIKKVQYNANVR